jgi:trehalose utilization protein
MSRAIVARIAKHEFQTEMRFPVPDVVFFLHKNLHQFSQSDQQKTVRSVKLQLWMKAGIIVKHVGHISAMLRQEK